MVSAAAVLLLALAPSLLSPFSITLLNYIGIYALVVLGLVLLTGVGGMLSFGQAAFVGIAAYATAWLTVKRAIRPGSAWCWARLDRRLVAAILGARDPAASAATSCRSAPSPGAWRSTSCSAMSRARAVQRHLRDPADRLGRLCAR